MPPVSLLNSSGRGARSGAEYSPGDTVTLYSDGPTDLYFTTESGFPANGGFILHEGSVNTVRGTFPKLQYAVHT